jgi:hypothetical protein
MLDPSRETEVDDFQTSARGNDGVGGLQISVHDTSIVRVCKRIRRFGPISHRVVDRHGTCTDQSGERFTVDVFHGDERTAALFADLVDRADVGMVQRGRRSRFAEDPGALGRTVAAVFEELDRSVALKARVVGEKHRAGATLAEGTLDPILAQAATRRKHRRNCSASDPCIACSSGG